MSRCEKRQIPRYCMFRPFSRRMYRSETQNSKTKLFFNFYRLTTYERSVMLPFVFRSLISFRRPRFFRFQPKWFASFKKPQTQRTSGSHRSFKQHMAPCSPYFFHNKIFLDTGWLFMWLFMWLLFIFPVFFNVVIMSLLSVFFSHSHPRIFYNNHYNLTWTFFSCSISQQSHQTH